MELVRNMILVPLGFRVRRLKFSLIHHKSKMSLVAHQAIRGDHSAFFNEKRKRHGKNFVFLRDLTVILDKNGKLRNNQARASRIKQITMSVSGMVIPMAVVPGS